MTDTVADDQRDAACVETDDVVPIAADLQRVTCRVVSHRKPTGQTRGCEHRVLHPSDLSVCAEDHGHPLELLASLSHPGIAGWFGIPVFLDIHARRCTVVG